MNKDGICKWGPKDTEMMNQPLWRLKHAKDMQQHGEFKRESIFAQKTIAYLEDGKQKAKLIAQQ